MFWGLALVALVILYAQTKDRWKWKKIGLTLVSLAVLSLVAVIAINWWNRPQYTYEPIPEPTLINSWWDIEVGKATKSDVKFLKGAPLEESTNDYGIDYFIYRRLTTSGEPLDRRIRTVRFRDDRVCSINYTIDRNPIKVTGILYTEAMEDLLGITMLHGLETLQDVFGEPEEITEYNNGLGRVYEYYDAYNVAFMLEREEVVGWAIGACD